MEELDLERRPQLTRPVLVASFRGWNDGGQGASMANAFLSRTWHAEKFASIDSEQFFDFQSTRPHVTLVEGTVRRIDWPENVFEHARPARSDRDAVLLLGTEPGLRWRTFAGLVSGLASDLGVELVVTLGALLADVPHTRPAPVTASASDPALMKELGVQPSRYEGPTGIVGVLNTMCREEGIPTASLWANVPHYISGIENPKAALALVRRTLLLLNAEADLSELSAASRQFEQNLNGIVAQNAKIAEYVSKLERKKPEDDDESPPPPDELPPAGDLVAEIEQFLRQQRPENNP
jgi:proteasome assembly chaperone (PAC2) family protein